MNRILVCGSRSWTDKVFIKETLQVLNETFEPMLIVHGAARGADRLAGEAAKELGFPVEEHPADWHTYGKRAGFLRNKEMVESGVCYVMAFWDGTSPGTKHTIDLARSMGIPTGVMQPKRAT